MFVTVQFKDRNKVFKGRTYDYLLNREETVPQVGQIIRLMDDNYNYLCHGTRVKVVGVKETSEVKEPVSVRYVEASLED